MITLSFSPVLGPDKETLREAFEKCAGCQVPRKDMKMVILDVLHRHQAFLTLRIDDGLQWTWTGTRFWPQYHRAGRGNKTAEVINLRKAANMMTENLQCGTSLIDLLRSTASYAQAFGAEYHVSFLDSRINDIVDDKISFEFLSLDSQSIQSRYISVTRFLFKRIKVLSGFKELGKESAGTPSVVVEHVDDVTILSSNEVDMKFRLQAPDAFLNNPVKPILFLAVSFYNHADFCRTGNTLTICIWDALPFRSLSLESQSANDAIKKPIYHGQDFNTMRLFNFNVCNRAGLYVAWSINGKRHLLFKNIKRLAWRRQLRRGQLSLGRTLAKKRKGCFGIGMLDASFS